jgi:hypothetical protein
MPRVPRFEPTARPAGPPDVGIRQRATPTEFGAGLGRQISQTGVQFAKIAAQETAQADQDALTSFKMTAIGIGERLLNHPTDGFRAKVQGGEFDGNSYKAIREQYDTEIREAFDQLDPRIQEKAGIVVQSRANLFDVDRNTIMSNAVKAIREGQLTQAEEAGIRLAVANFRDQGVVDYEFFDALQSSHGALEGLGLSEDEIVNRIRDYTSRFWEAVITRAIEEDPDIARHYMEISGKEVLDAGTFSKLERAIDRKEDEQLALDKASETYNEFISTDAPIDDDVVQRGRIMLEADLAEQPNVLKDATQQYDARVSDAKDARKAIVRRDAEKRLTAIRSGISRLEAIELANTAEPENRFSLMAYINKTMPDPAAEFEKTQTEREESAQSLIAEYEAKIRVEQLGPNPDPADLLNILRDVPAVLQEDVLTHADKVREGAIKVSEVDEAIRFTMGRKPNDALRSRIYKSLRDSGQLNLRGEPLRKQVEALALKYTVVDPELGTTQRLQGTEVIGRRLQEVALPVLSDEQFERARSRMVAQGLPDPNDSEDPMAAAQAFVKSDLFGPTALGLDPEQRLERDIRRAGVTSAQSYLKGLATTAQAVRGQDVLVGRDAMLVETARAISDGTIPAWGLDALRRADIVAYNAYNRSKVNIQTREELDKLNANVMAVLFDIMDGVARR